MSHNNIDNITNIMKNYISIYILNNMSKKNLNLSLPAASMLYPANNARLIIIS